MDKGSTDTGQTVENLFPLITRHSREIYTQNAQNS